MSNKNLNLVWFKRDLRIRDHEPICLAARSGSVLPLYIIEPGILGAPDMDAMHYEFVRECLVELREALTALGAPLVVRVGNAVEVLTALHEQTGFSSIYAHEETGNGLTYARDLHVSDWARMKGVPLLESPCNGVVRRLQDRDGWSRIWSSRMNRPVLEPPQRITGIRIDVGPIPDASAIGLSHRHPAVAVREQAQRGGESAAAETLDSFVAERGRRYQREISAPAVARRSCSRLSPYIAYGVLSIRQIVDYVRESDFDGRPASAFLSRLHWHCHFIQKLESEPAIEYRCFNPLYESLRGEPDRALLEAWQTGRTGYPFVDACIRSLQATGWINFRMRAMLTSFAAYDLWLDWRAFKDFLARQFIDYEPGIHISQLQMQSGVTGINTPRMYNPVKQGYDHDPNGDFVRQWVPELVRVPDLFVHEPWKMSPLEVAETRVRPGQEYPLPVVDHSAAIRRARKAIALVRHSEDHREAADSVFVRHGSRRRPADRQSKRQYRATRSRGQDAPRFDQANDDGSQLSLFE